MTDEVEQIMNVTDRIDQYFDVGGLFNPEHMEHEKVRELLWDARSYIKELEYDNWQKLSAITAYDIQIKKYKRLLEVAMEE